MKLFSDGMELTSSYAHEQADLILKNEIQIIVTTALPSGFSFDLIVCAGPSVLPLDDRVWRRMIDIRRFVASADASLLETCVHPQNPSMEVAVHTVPCTEELKSFVYGTLNGGAAEEDKEKGGSCGVGDGGSKRRVGLPFDVALRQELSAIGSLLKTIISKNWDVPCLPLLAKCPPKTGLRALLGAAKTMTHHRWRLFFVCPVSMKVALSGPRGRGYKIEEPRRYIARLLPLLQISCVIISIAMKSLGVPFTLPFPDGLTGKSLLDGNAFLASARRLLSEGTEEDSEVDPVTTVKEALANGSPLEISDAAFDALAVLLRACGDPMPNGRPLYSGLVGPIVSASGDGSVAWVSLDEVEHFKKTGAACFGRKDASKSERNN